MLAGAEPDGDRARVGAVPMEVALGGETGGVGDGEEVFLPVHRVRGGRATKRHDVLGGKVSRNAFEQVVDAGVRGWCAVLGASGLPRTEGQ